MGVTARLHLPHGVLDLDVAAGGAVAIPPLAVAALVRQVDPRDRIHVGGRRVDRLPTAGRVRRGLALLPDAAVAPDVAVIDHLAAVVPRRRARALLDSSPLLRGRGSDPAGVLSGGERQVLALLRAAAVEPRAAVLDGPGEGLDPATLAWVGDLLARWRDDGVAVLLRIGRPEERAWLRT